MKESELKRALSKILPTARTAFTGKIDPPYIIYMPNSRTKAITADDSAAARITPWRIEIYSDRLMPEIYQKVEDALDSMGVIWTEDEAVIPDEDMIIKYYFFEEWEEREP